MAWTAWVSLKLSLYEGGGGKRCPSGNNRKLDFSRLQSLGANGLSTTHAFEVKRVFATISAGVCGVVNSLCHNCLSSSGLEVGGPTSSDGNFTLQDSESVRVTKSQPDLSVHQSSDEDNSTELFV